MRYRWRGGSGEYKEEIGLVKAKTKCVESGPTNRMVMHFCQYWVLGKEFQCGVIGRSQDGLEIKQKTETNVALLSCSRLEAMRI